MHAYAALLANCTISISASLLSQADDWDKGSLLGFRAISFSEQLPAYDSIRQPVLVVQGRQDATIPTRTATAVHAALLRL